MRMQDLKNQFKEGSLGKRLYWTLMREKLVSLPEIWELIRENDNVKGIEVNKKGIVLERADGVKMYFDFSQTICRAESHLIMEGDPEQEDINAINKMLAAHGIDGLCGDVLDIGANAGLFTLTILKNNCDVRVHSFEPIRYSYDLMKRNLELNEIDPSRVRINNVGMSDQKGEATFYLPGQSEAASLKPITDRFCMQASNGLTGEKIGQSVQEENCTLLTIDDYVKAEKINNLKMIKIDTEGNELCVLKGGLKTIEKYQPFIYSELLRKHASKFGYHPNDVIRLMNELGYSCYTIRNSKLVDVSEIEESTQETNFFFLHSIKHQELLNVVNRSN